MKAAIHLMLVLVVMWAGIHPAADPPDPSWIDGIYDDDDGDGGMVALGACDPGSGDVTAGAPSMSRDRVCAGRAMLALADAPLAGRRSSLGSRSPPRGGAAWLPSPAAAV